MRTTSFDFENEEAIFKVLVNHEEQYSLWPADLPVPGGWTETGQKGSKDECDEYVNRVWTDMRPKSLREFMDRNSAESTESAGSTESGGNTVSAENTGDAQAPPSG